MTSVVGICNRALQKLGASAISALDENSKNARECSSAYESLRDAELRSHPWGFAIKRVQLPASSTAPAFGRARMFTLPADNLRLLAQYPELNDNHNDWQVESDNEGSPAILTNDAAPLNVRYVARMEDPTVFDAMFVEALASRIAYELCEAITQSNTKKQAAAQDYTRAISEARRINAIERVAQKPPEDEWVTVRN